MTAAALHELTELRRMAVALRDRLLTEFDALVGLVSRMEDTAQETAETGVPAAGLVFGDFVKVGGEWLQLIGRDGHGVLELVDKATGQRTYYEPTEGETFPVESAF